MKLTPRQNSVKAIAPLFLSLAALAIPANAAVTMAAVGASNPDVGASGISQFNSAGTLNGTADFTDNAGGTSQSFTITASGSYTLNSISVKLSDDFGGGVFTSGTFSLQVFRFDNIASGGYAERNEPKAGQSYGTAYLNNPFQTMVYTGIANLGADPLAGDWITFSFSAADLLTLAGGSSYGFSIASTSGWAGLAVADSDVYADGQRWAAYGLARTFNDNYINPSKNFAADHTFAVNLTAVPEPSGSVLLLGGLAAFIHRRNRR